MPELTAEQEVLLQEEMQRIAAERQRVFELARQQERGAESIIAQIQGVRQELETSVGRLHDLCQQLRASVRQLSGDEGAHHYLMFANGHIRLAGALSQGVRRTAAMDRLLTAAKAEKEEVQRRDEQQRQLQESRDRQRAIDHLQLPQDDDFEDLYGEVMSDA
jgi:hypothetical protein